MTGKRHKDTRRAISRAVAQRRARVAELFHAAVRQRMTPTGAFRTFSGVIGEIAAQCNVNISQITRDLQALDLVWKETAVTEIVAAKELILAHYRRIIDEAWAEWERSRTQEPTEDVVEGAPGPDGKIIPQHARRSKRSAAGDTRYFAAINQALAGMRAVLGADEAAKLDATIDGDGSLKVIVEYVRAATQTDTAGVS